MENNRESLLVSLTTEEITLIRDALGAVKFLKPRESKLTEASLCKKFTEILKEPNKHLAYLHSPRLMPWMRKTLGD